MGSRAAPESAQAQAAAADQQPDAPESQLLAGERREVSSGGPALTSDGGHTSSASSSCGPSSPPIASSSSDECADTLGKLVGANPSAVVGVREEPDKAGCSCERPQEQPSEQLKVEADGPKSGSRLRQLLHLESKAASKPHLSAIAGGYYAYSPVVQTNSEASESQATSQVQSKSESTQKSSKRSWLMSKFSLSSGNVAACHQDQAKSALDPLTGPPRKAELISMPVKACAEPDQDERRPKSSLSALSADLMAAQKSLAAAAAAKVRRDRLVRLANNASSSQSLLTVKTQPGGELWSAGSEPPDSQANLGRYGLDGQLMHRPGTNSAGMSDSSPSNNGAESDNSTQTTGSLGILSRILLHSKSSKSGQASSKPAQLADSNICSSSALSSPATTNGSSQQQSPSQLDQLGSRSRRPIVVGRSNEPEEAPAHPLPPKSALKSNAEPINGLPRVSSYTHLSQPFKQPLCNYHAFASRTNLMHEHHQMFVPQHFYPAYNSVMIGNGRHLPMHQLSQHDIRNGSFQPETSSGEPIDQLGQVNGVANYEYYMDPDEPAHYPDYSQLHAAYGLHAMSAFQPQQLERSQIYIPPYLVGAHQVNRPKSSLDNFLQPSSSAGFRQTSDGRASHLGHPVYAAGNGAIYASSMNAPGARSLQLAAGEQAKARNGLTVLPAERQPRALGAEGGPARLDGSPVASTADQGAQSHLDGPCQSAKQSLPENQQQAARNSWTPTTTTVNVYKSLVRVNQPSVYKSNQSSRSHQVSSTASEQPPTDKPLLNGLLNGRDSQDRRVKEQPDSEPSPVDSSGQQNHKLPINRPVHLAPSQPDASPLRARQTNNSNRCTNGVKIVAGQQGLLINSDDNHGALALKVSLEQQINAKFTANHHQVICPALKDRDSVESATNSSDSWSSPGQLNATDPLPDVGCIQDGASTIL